MNKKTRFSLIGIIVLMLFLIGLTILLIVIKPSSQSIIQASEYTCPSGYTCQVTPILKCTNAQSDAKVIFRTDAIVDSSDTMKDKWENRWIAIDLEGESLMAFDKGNYGYSGGASCSGTQLKKKDGFPLLTPDGYQINFDSRNNRLIIYNGCERYVKFPISVNPQIPTSFGSIDRYRLAHQEIIEGDLYSCLRSIKINGIEKEKLSWNADTSTPSTGKRGNTYTLNGNEPTNNKITTDGTGIIEIEYLNNLIPPEPVTKCQACSGTQTISIGQKICCDKYTLEECIVVVNSNPKINKIFSVPPQICRNGEILDAYNVIIDIEKRVISFQEKFVINFELKNNPNNKDIPIIATISQGNLQINTKTQYTGTGYFDAGKTTFEFEAPLVGSYLLKISFNHPDGNYISEGFDIRVSESLIIETTSDNPIQYDNKPIVFYIKGSKSGSPKQISNIVLSVKYNGIIITKWTKENPTLGTYKYSISGLQGDGELVINANGCDETGLCVDSNEYRIEVKKSSILFSDVSFVTDVCTGTYKNSFSTKDPVGNYIDTTNVVTINKPLAGSDIITASEVDKGKYEFNYNFNEGGLYVIKIASTSSELGSSQLNGGAGQTIDILSGSACEDDCEGWMCNWEMYLIIGGFVIAIIVFLVLILRRRK